MGACFSPQNNYGSGLNHQPGVSVADALHDWADALRECSNLPGNGLENLRTLIGLTAPSLQATLRILAPHLEAEFELRVAALSREPRTEAVGDFDVPATPDEAWARLQLKIIQMLWAWARGQGFVLSVTDPQVKPIGQEHRRFSPNVARAFSQYEQAIRENSDLQGAKDEAVHAWVRAHLDRNDPRLPHPETWIRYVRKARSAHGQQKHRPRRTIRSHGSSIVLVKDHGECRIEPD
jgi:hypothetical protein